MLLKMSNERLSPTAFSMLHHYYSLLTLLVHHWSLKNFNTYVSKCLTLLNPLTVKKFISFDADVLSEQLSNTREQDLLDQFVVMWTTRIHKTVQQVRTVEMLTYMYKTSSHLIMEWPLNVLNS